MGVVTMCGCVSVCVSECGELYGLWSVYVGGECVLEGEWISE